jgi:hypothetical protein
MSPLVPLGCLALLTACGSSSGGASFGPGKDGGGLSDAAAHMTMPPAPAKSDATTPATVPSATCHPSALSTAPIECMESWTRAKIIYKRECAAARGGYRAACEPYDAIVFNTLTTETWCLYDRGTGNLILTKQTRGGATTCLAFDPVYTEPDTAGCAPVSSAACAPDSGAP